MRRIACVTLLAALVAVILTGAGTAAHRKHDPWLHSTVAQVVIPRGQPLQVAFTADTTDAPDYSQSFENAIRMAIEQRPRIKGFPIQLNVVETRCGQDPNVDADDTAAALTIVSNPQNAAVLGNLCSNGFASALTVYQAAGLLALTGSATADWVPTAPVLDRTVVTDGDGFASWYPLVRALPSDLEWQDDYAAEFGAAPMPYADLYYDAASLLFQRLRQVATRDSLGDLVVGRAALAGAVRDTIGFPGVSCTISLSAADGKRVNDPAALAACAGG